MRGETFLSSVWHDYFGKIILEPREKLVQNIIQQLSDSTIPFCRNSCCGAAADADMLKLVRLCVATGSDRVLSDFYLT